MLLANVQRLVPSHRVRALFTSPGSTKTRVTHCMRDAADADADVLIFTYNKGMTRALTRGDSLGYPYQRRLGTFYAI